jgi:hypothetical protein
VLLTIIDDGIQIVAFYSMVFDDDIDIDDR